VKRSPRIATTRTTMYGRKILGMGRRFELGG
jgi:hypothetical protein